MSETNEIANRVHDQVAGINRVTLFPATSKRIVDASGASVTYVGVAAPGTATSSSSWLVEKVSVSGDTTTITHATGTWDDRASLTYA